MSDPLQKRIGLGFTLGMDPTGGSTFVVLGAIVDGLDEDGGSMDIADMSILSDTYKTKAGGQIDPGKATFQIAYDGSANNTTAGRLAAARAITGVVSPAFQRTYPAANGQNSFTENFSGWVTKLGKAIKKDKMIVQAVEIDISGNPGTAGG